LLVWEVFKHRDWVDKTTKAYDHKDTNQYTIQIESITLNPEELSPQEQEYLQTHDEKVN
jgi:hypothetical protein